MTTFDAELRADIGELGRLTSQTDLNRRDEARRDFLLSKIATRQAPTGKVSRETREWFNHLPDEGEYRGTDIFAGTQSISYTQGSAGGFLVPNSYADQIILGMAQYDPLLDGAVVTLRRTENGQPLTQPAWDLSTFRASLVSEGAQQTPQSVPPTSGKILNAWTFRASLDASFEFEQDSFEETINLMALAYSVGFARGVGAYLATGSGTNQPQGILTGATYSGVSLSQGIVNDVSTTLADKFLAAYFSVNRIYRASPKCSWCCSDETYQWLRSLSDKQARPLLRIEDDKETILGKPVYISPSLPSYSASPSVTGQIVFGDLSHFVVRATSLSIARNVQTPGMIEAGKALYVGRLRCDSALVDPTNGTYSPVCYINVTA